MAAPIALAAGQIAEAMNGRLVAGDADHYVTGFSIDTRTLATGDLFFAIVAKRVGVDAKQFHVRPLSVVALLRPFKTSTVCHIA